MAILQLSPLSKIKRIYSTFNKNLSRVPKLVINSICESRVEKKNNKVR